MRIKLNVDCVVGVGKTAKVGDIVDVPDVAARELIAHNRAEAYSGEIPKEATPINPTKKKE